MSGTVNVLQVVIYNHKGSPQFEVYPTIIMALCEHTFIGLKCELKLRHFGMGQQFDLAFPKKESFASFQITFFGQNLT